MRIAVIGGGPSGSVAAALLVRAGHDVVIFDEDERPPVLVGESLVPGLIPVLRELGLEERVAAMGVYKPGVSFQFGENKEFAFSFQSLSRKYPRYAYNVPRPQFDNLLKESAIASGARLVAARAGVLARGSRLELDPATLEQVADWQDQQPDLVIDASGRRRLSAKTLQLTARVGERKDVAHFAHFTGFAPETPSGQVRINRLERGWSWRIPLQGKMSFGIVLNQRDAAALGETPEQRLEAAIERDPRLRREVSAPCRLTPVQTYANYQLISACGTGENWAAIGDAFGFVDPMLSPGMMVATESASILVQALKRKPLAQALEQYSQGMTCMLQAWMDLIAYFYNGRIFRLNDIGRALQERYRPLPLGFIETFMSGILSSMASGFTTGSRFSQGVLKSVDRRIVGPVLPQEEYAIL